MKKTVFCLYLFASLILVVACTKEKIPNDDNTFKPGKLAWNDTLILAYQIPLVDELNQLSLTFDSVLSESRCPIGALCASDGCVSLQFTFKKGTKVFPFMLDSTCKPDTTVEGYKFSYIWASPYPDGHRVDDSEYRVKLKFIP